MKKNIGSKLALYPMSVIQDAPLTLECSVVDVYETPKDAEGKINYNTLKPVLFEFPTYQYLKTGDVICKCLSLKEKQSKEREKE